MVQRWSRRGFIRLSSGIGALGVPALDLQSAPQPSAAPGASRSPAAAAAWPRQDPAIIQEMVGVCHRDVKRVQELVELQPALANAAVDWGFGDWEDALGAASHTGRRAIAEVLLAHGARPSIFSAAMLGQLDVVKALVAARSGVERTYGPHGITLMAHARAGGADAEPVVKYLESLGDADRRLTAVPLEPRDRDAVVGRYAFGAGERDYVEVGVVNDQLGIIRPGGNRLRLSHTGDLTFFPAGVPSVKIAFARDGARVVRMTIADPGGLVIAVRP